MKPIILMLTCLFSVSCLGQEICDNNIDDDNDRLIDLYDLEDCPCLRGEIGGASMLPNPSFEILDSLPFNFSQLGWARGWKQSTLGTADLFSKDGFLPNWTPEEASDGKNYAGTIFETQWKEYLGTCLTGPMLAGQEYDLKFDVAFGVFNGELDPDNILAGPVDITLYGNSNCQPGKVQTYDCPIGIEEWTVLGSINYTPALDWKTMQMKFTPAVDVYSVMIGPPCDLPQAYGGVNMYYVFWDNLQLNRIPDEVIYYVPNAFTPDGDEHNQLFQPVFVCGFDPGEYLFQVYNRWGETVFESRDPLEGWDGMKNNSPSLDGVYLWRLEFSAADSGYAKQLTGHLTLIR